MSVNNQKIYTAGMALAFIVIATFAIAAFATAGEPYEVNDRALYDSLKGKIVLAVEEAGEAFYIHPDREEAFYLGRPDDAFAVMRSEGIGITNAQLEKIPMAVSHIGSTNEETDADLDGLPDALEDAIGTDANDIDTDDDGVTDYFEVVYDENPLGPGYLKFDTAFTNAVKGKIFLQVEQNGEAWYVYPGDGRRYFLGRPADAFSIMRELGLGISSDNLDRLIDRNRDEILAGDHVRGPKNAEIIMIEYADLECPYCSRHHPNMMRLREDYPGQIAWVFRHFPLSFHLNARNLAETSECAALQGGDDAFWDFIDYVLSDQYEDDYPYDDMNYEDMGDIAHHAAGVDPNQVTQCLIDGTVKEKIDNDYQLGIDSGVMGTPATIFIDESGNSQKVMGAVPYESLESVVDSIL